MLLNLRVRLHGFIILHYFSTIFFIIWTYVVANM